MRSMVEGADLARTGKAGLSEAVGRVIALREAADGLFRAAVERQALGTTALAEMLSAAADCLHGVDEEVGAPGNPFGVGPKPLRLRSRLPYPRCRWWRESSGGG